jgi:hypothetical protein
MKKHLFFGLFILCAFLLSTLAAPAPARADVIDKLARISDLIHPYSSAFPSYDEVENAKPIITCIAGGGNAVTCLAQAGGSTGNEYIDTVVTLAQLYHMVEEEDVMGIVGIVGQWLGDEAPCIIVDIITGGAGGDLCDLVKAIVEIAAKAVDAVLDFLVGLGEAVWDGLKAAAEAACEVFSLGMADCGDDNSVPWYVLGYQLVFAPKISDGVAAREGVNDTFDSVLASLKSQLLQTKVGMGMGFTQSDADMAGEMYRAVVEAAWSGDIVKVPDGKIWKLNKQRETYFDDQQIMSQMVAEAVTQPNPSAYIWNRCTDDFKNTYGFAYIDRWLNWPIADANVKAAQKSILSNSKWCSDVYEYKHRHKELKDLYSAYVDKNLCKAVGDAFVCPSKSNLDACVRIMGSGVSYEDGQRCGLKPSTCQITGSGGNLGLTCDTLDDYKACLSIMKGEESRCHTDIQKTGMQIAAMIDDYFKQNSSQIPCQYGVFDFSKGGNPSTPVSFICSRPTQQYWCKSAYTDIVGSSSPIKFVDCILTEDADYGKLRQRVGTVVQLLKQGETNNLHPQGAVSMTSQSSAASSVTEASASSALKQSGNVSGKLQATKGGGSGKTIHDLKPYCANKIYLDDIDPLLVLAEACVVNRVKNDVNQDFGFKAPSAKPGFDYVKPASWNKIDGLTTPLMQEESFVENASKLAGKPPLATESLENKLKKKLQGGTFKEEVINPDTGMEQGRGAAINSMQSGMTTAKTGAAVVGPAVAAEVMGNGLPAAGTTQTKTMSTTLPEGTSPGKQAALPGGMQPMSLTLSYPDVTATAQVRILNHAYGWNDTITVDAKQAFSVNKNNSGLCEFEIEYSLSNIGAGNAGSFRSVWTNSAVGGSWNHLWPSLASKGTSSGRDVLPLKPGINRLQLVIDDLHQLKESDTANNIFRITINVTGNCGNASLPAGPVKIPSASGGVVIPPAKR